MCCALCCSRWYCWLMHATLFYKRTHEHRHKWKKQSNYIFHQDISPISAQWIPFCMALNLNASNLMTSFQSLCHWKHWAGLFFLSTIIISFCHVVMLVIVWSFKYSLDQVWFVKLIAKGSKYVCSRYFVDLDSEKNEISVPNKNGFAEIYLIKFTNG